MKTMFYFVRHAQPNYDNHDDMSRELTAKGLADRRLVTEFLDRQGIEVVLSSPYKRAIDTLKEFADKQGLEIHPLDDFRERRIDSVWIADFPAFSKRQWEDFQFKLSDGESLSEVQERNVGALRYAMNTYAGKRIAVGSHGTALSTLINHFDKTFGYEAFQAIQNRMPWIVKFVFENESCVEIEKIDLFAL
jgi:2,3-bisphosphoglycerate-dependent phosphoglycerate mutase